ncbi:hypothetical protein BJV77DRAFT_968513 [Russula vinacea]|nr:hypothetical protein BJV77DRAFT_968513 [Russula vinacea]
MTVERSYNQTGSDQSHDPPHDQSCDQEPEPISSQSCDKEHEHVLRLNQQLIEHNWICINSYKGKCDLSLNQEDNIFRRGSQSSDCPLCTTTGISLTKVTCLVEWHWTTLLLFFILFPLVLAHIVAILPYLTIVIYCLQKPVLAQHKSHCWDYKQFKVDHMQHSDKALRLRREKGYIAQEMKLRAWSLSESYYMMRHEKEVLSMVQDTHGVRQSDSL